MKAIEIYLQHFDGNQTKAAKALGKKQGHVWHWLNKADDMPMIYVPKAASIIGKRASDLMPNVEWS